MRQKQVSLKTSIPESRFFTQFDARFERFERFFETTTLKILLQNERFERFLSGF